MATWSLTFSSFSRASQIRLFWFLREPTPLWFPVSAKRASSLAKPISTLSYGGGGIIQTTHLLKWNRVLLSFGLISQEYASEGLRTLVCAYREIPQEEYDAWKGKFHAASVSLENRFENSQYFILSFCRLWVYYFIFVGVMIIILEVHTYIFHSFDRVQRAGGFWRLRHHWKGCAPFGRYGYRRLEIGEQTIRFSLFSEIENWNGLNPKC